MKEVSPLLFMKTGVICSEPLDFYDRLAEQYGADLHSTDDVCLELTGGRFSRERQIVLAVRAETEQRTRNSLTLGHNAVYDGYLNTHRRRETVRDEVAQPLGAIPILICMHAPMDLVKERIYVRHEQDALSIPVSEIPDVDSSITVAEKMVRSVQWPHNESHVNLNGTLDTDYLLERLDRYIHTEL